MSDEFENEAAEAAAFAAEPAAEPASAVSEVHALLNRLTAEVDGLKSAPHAMAEWVKSIVAEIRAKL